MLLHDGECVLCENLEETVCLAEILEENGFCMFDKTFGTITQCVADRINGKPHCGWRWMIGNMFPYCIAGMSASMCKEVKKTGKITDANGTNPHTWISFSDFMKRIQPMGVEDLI